MPLDLRHITVYEQITDPRTGDIDNVRTGYHPILRLRGDHAAFPVFLQDGHIYAEGGGVLHEPPEWFEAELAKCRPEALAACGFPIPSLPNSLPAAQGISPPGDYVPCTACGDMVRVANQAHHQRHCHGMQEERAVEAPPPLPQAPRSKAYWICPDCGDEMLKFHMKDHSEQCHAAIHE